MKKGKKEKERRKWKINCDQWSAQVDYPTRFSVYEATQGKWEKSIYNLSPGDVLRLVLNTNRIKKN